MSAQTVTPYNVGRYCLSEDACIAASINFAAYERGVSDAARAFEQNAVASQAPAEDLSVIGVDLGAPGGDMTAGITTFRPTAEELALLNAGGSIVIGTAGSIPPEITIKPNDTPVAKPKGGQLAKLAAIWCADEHFQKWIMAADADSARKKICLKCGVTSRAELDHNKAAAHYFHMLIREPYSRARKLQGLDA